MRKKNPSWFKWVNTWEFSSHDGIVCAKFYVDFGFDHDCLLSWEGDPATWEGEMAVAVIGYWQRYKTQSDPGVTVEIPPTVVDRIRNCAILGANGGA
jgi:hypothetical protein